MVNLFKKNNNSNLIEEKSIEIEGDRSSVDVDNNKKLPIKQILAVFIVIVFGFAAIYTFISSKINSKNREVIYEVETAQKEQYNREESVNLDISQLQKEAEEKARREEEERARRELEELLSREKKPTQAQPTTTFMIEENKSFIDENQRLYEGSILLPDSNISAPQISSTTLNEESTDYRTSSGDFLQGGYFANGSVSKVLNRDYLLPSGTVLACVLRTKVVTTYEGLVMCQLSKDVYSDNGKNLLVRAGSILEGTQTKVMMQGQGRVFINWNTIRDRDVLVRIDALGTDTLGASGVPAWVDTHFWKRFGNALLLSFIDDAFAVAQAHANKSINYENVTIGDSFSQGNRMAEMALENSINIPPTAYINQGELINIIVPRNVDFSPVYKNISIGSR